MLYASLINCTWWCRPWRVITIDIHHIAHMCVCPKHYHFCSFPLWLVVVICRAIISFTIYPFFKGPIVLIQLMISLWPWPINIFAIWHTVWGYVYNIDWASTSLVILRKSLYIRRTTYVTACACIHEEQYSTNVQYSTNCYVSAAHMYVY